MAGRTGRPKPRREDCIFAYRNARKAQLAAVEVLLLEGGLALPSRPKIGNDYLDDIPEWTGDFAAFRRDDREG